ncbi:MAG: nucleotidyltransferase domain-containing protein [Planctomycetota bacterium]
MVAIIDAQRGALEALCRKHRVRRLEVFGSVADGTFDPDRSDIDFLVEFFPFQPGTAFDTYFGLLEGLEATFGRKVDLVDATCLRNPYLIRGVNETRTTIYEAPPEQVPR